MKHTAYHHKNLRIELIEKGIELVEEYGMQQLSLRKVAQECNVSHAAPYSHFKNKDDLILQCRVILQISLRNDCRM